MDDKRHANPISLWCYAKEPGNVLIAAAPVPCKKEACERYRGFEKYHPVLERRESIIFGQTFLDPELPVYLFSKQRFFSRYRKAGAVVMRVIEMT